MREAHKRSRKTLAEVQMVILAMLMAAITVASLSYIVLAKPAFLRRSRFGVPFYSSQVIDPVTNRPLDLNGLAAYYVHGQKGAKAK